MGTRQMAHLDREIERLTGRVGQIQGDLREAERKLERARLARAAEEHDMRPGDLVEHRLHPEVRAIVDRYATSDFGRGPVTLGVRRFNRDGRMSRRLDGGYAPTMWRLVRRGAAALDDDGRL